MNKKEKAELSLILVNACNTLRKAIEDGIVERKSADVLAEIFVEEATDELSPEEASPANFDALFAFLMRQSEVRLLIIGACSEFVIDLLDQLRLSESEKNAILESLWIPIEPGRRTTPQEDDVEQNEQNDKQSN